MTDFEMIKVCAEAMRFKLVYPDDASLPVCIETARGSGVYRPLEDDAQAMALVKRFGLNIEHYYWDDPLVSKHDAHGKLLGEARNANLNRAIVECVAAMRAACGVGVT